MCNNLILNNVESIRTLDSYKQLLALKDRLSSIENEPKDNTNLSDKTLLKLIQDTLCKVKDNDRFCEYITLEIINSIGNLIDIYEINRNFLPKLKNHYIEILDDLTVAKRSLVQIKDNEEDFISCIDFQSLEDKINNLIQEVFSEITHKENYIMVWSLAVQYKTLITLNYSLA